MRSIFLFAFITALVVAEEYIKYRGVDCTGNDIHKAQTENPEELKKICDNTKGCIGFNTHGWLKNKCPNQEVQPDVDSYLLSSIFVPSGKEPNILLWPMPAEYKSGDAIVPIDSVNLRFHANIESSELRNAFNRMKSTAFKHRILSAPAGSIKDVVITIKNKEVDFVTTKDESYTLSIPDDGSAIEITADNIYGAYHALNSLTFLIQYHFESGSYIIKHAPYKIDDKPFLHYRALLIDSSRHFLPLRSIKNIIDAMSWVKLNVLHWHIVDDEAFPIYIKSVPSMWNGAYSDNEKYTQYDVEEIVEYAKARGVHVIAEADVPGHAKSWCVGNPAMCPSAECPTPLDPSKETTFETIDLLLKDLMNYFPGEYFHIGGDEVNTKCWNEVSRVKEWMVSKNFTEKDAYGYFVKRVDELVKKQGRQTIVWEEVYVSHKEIIPKDMIIHIWLGDGERLKNVVKDGFRAIISNYKHWYLPQLWETWEYYYGNDLMKDIPREQWNQIIGGEVCMWGEWVDASDFENTIFPRAIAAAERMWTQPELMDQKAAGERLAYIRCEYNRRGIGAGPTFGTGRMTPPGPGSCMKQ